MLLFKIELVRAIVNGEKDETRRIWKPKYPRPRPGSRRKCYVRPPFLRENPGVPFVQVEILDRWTEMLGMISPTSVRAEGFDDITEFIRVWTAINKVWEPGKIIDVVKFKVVMINEAEVSRIMNELEQRKVNKR